MDRLMVVRESVQLQTIKGDALHANGDLGQVRPYLGVESVLVHAQEPRSVPDSDQPGINHLSRPCYPTPIHGRLAS